MARLFLMVSLMVFASACGSSYSYDLTFNDCGTGKHEFDSVEKLCEGLKNRELNKSPQPGCTSADTYKMRKDTFKERGCSGEFIET